MLQATLMDQYRMFYEGKDKRYLPRHPVLTLGPVKSIHDSHAWWWSAEPQGSWNEPTYHGQI